MTGERGTIRTREPAEDALGAKESEAGGDVGHDGVRVEFPTTKRMKVIRLCRFFFLFFLLKHPPKQSL